MPRDNTDPYSVNLDVLNIDWELVDINQLEWKEPPEDIDWKGEQLKEEIQEQREERSSTAEHQEKFEEFLEARTEECLDRIRNPDPRESHEVVGRYETVREAVLSYVGEGEVSVSEHRTPGQWEHMPTVRKLFSCSCGARNMTWDEAGNHLEQIHER